MCSVYKEKAILRDQYPSVKVGEPSFNIQDLFSVQDSFNIQD